MTSSIKLELPDGVSSDLLLRRRHSTSVTANLIESIPSKLQLPINEGAVIVPNAGKSVTTNTTTNKSGSGHSQFNSFLRRSSAAFIGDFRRGQPGNIMGSSISEEDSDLMSKETGQNIPNNEINRASILPGAKANSDAFKCRGNLLNTVNGNFTAATRTSLLSQNRAGF